MNTSTESIEFHHNDPQGDNSSLYKAFWNISEESEKWVGDQLAVIVEEWGMTDADEILRVRNELVGQVLEEMAPVSS